MLPVPRTQDSILIIPREELVPYPTRTQDPEVHATFLHSPLTSLPGD